MAFLRLSPGRAGQGKARSLVLPCRARGGEEIVLPANTKVPHLWLPRALSSIPPGRCCRQMGQLSPSLGAGGSCHWGRGYPWPPTVPATRPQTQLPGAGQEEHHGFRGPEGHAGAQRCSGGPHRNTHQCRRWDGTAAPCFRLTRRAAEQGHLQEPRTQRPLLQSHGACQQHSSPCHMQGQAACQLPNPAAPPHPIRGDKHREAVAAPCLFPQPQSSWGRGRWARHCHLPRARELLCCLTLSFSPLPGLGNSSCLAPSMAFRARRPAVG